MKFKKGVALITILLLLLSFSACSLISEPRETIKDLISALKIYDVDQINELVTEFPNNADCGVTYDLFSDDIYIQLYKTAYQKLTYKIDSVSETDTSATVTVRLTHPDLNTAYSSATYSALALVMADEQLYAEFMANPDKDYSYLVPQQIINQYTTGNIEEIETTYTLTLKNINGEWKLVTDNELKNLISSNLYNIAANINTQTTQE